MSASMTKTVTAYHERLAQAVTPLRGQVVTLQRIRDAFLTAFPEATDKDLKWIMGTDHSVNHGNRGPCECAKTDRALFNYLKRDSYKVL